MTMKQAALARLVAADQANIDFQHRGQTFAMWYTGGSSAVLIGAGLACIFLAVVSAIGQSLGLGAGGILIAGGLFTGLSKIIGKFLPVRPGDSSESRVPSE
jgi:hypothetical protein